MEQEHLSPVCEMNTHTFWEIFFIFCLSWCLHRFPSTIQFLLLNLSQEFQKVMKSHYLPGSFKSPHQTPSLKPVMSTRQWPKKIIAGFTSRLNTVLLLFHILAQQSAIVLVYRSPCASNDGTILSKTSRQRMERRGSGP